MFIKIKIRQFIEQNPNYRIVAPCELIASTKMKCVSTKYGDIFKIKKTKDAMDFLYKIPIENVFVVDIDNRYFFLVTTLLKPFHTKSNESCFLCGVSLNSETANEIFQGNREIKGGYLAKKYCVCDNCNSFLICPICGKLNDLNRIKSLFVTKDNDLTQIKDQMTTLLNKTKNQNKNIKTGIPCCDCIGLIE